MKQLWIVVLLLSFKDTKTLTIFWLASIKAELKYYKIQPFKNYNKRNLEKEELPRRNLENNQ